MEHDFEATLPGAGLTGCLLAVAVASACNLPAAGLLIAMIVLGGGGMVLASKVFA